MPPRSAAYLLRASFVFTIMAAGWAACVTGQTTDQRTAIEGLRDTLRRIDSPARLGAIPRDWSGTVPAALRDLRRGYVTLRAAELSGRLADFNEALRYFDQALRREPDWPYLHFGMALARHAMHQRKLLATESARHPPGSSNYDDFVADITAALIHDPGFAPAITMAADLLSRQGEREQPSSLLGVLAPAADRSGTDPRLSLVLGRGARMRADLGDAIREFESYLGAGGDSGVAGLELARTLYAVGRLPEAEAEYWAGLRHPGDEGRAIYRSDMSWIAKPGELDSFDRTPTDSLGRWVRTFWAERDALEIREPGERLLEHLRRWNYVHEHFRILDPEKRTLWRLYGAPIADCEDSKTYHLEQLGFMDPDRLADDRAKERVLDHRAIIYMRHGEPARRIHTVGFSEAPVAITPPLPARASPPVPEVSAASPGKQAAGGGSGRMIPVPPIPDASPIAESWLYWFAGKSRVFHFHGDTALGEFSPTTLFAMPVLDPGFLDDLSRLDSRYHALAERIRYPSRVRSIRCNLQLQEILEDTREDMATAVVTDSYSLLYPEPLGVIVQIFQVGAAADGDAKLLVVFAVPGRTLRPVPSSEASNDLTYRLGVRIVATDTARHQILRLDTTRVFVASGTIRRDLHLSGLLQLPLPAGTWHIGVSVRQPGYESGTSVVRDSVVTPLGTDRLWVSDLVTGRGGTGLVWTRHGESMELNPLDAYPLGSSAEVYYEVGGLVPGADYRTTVTVRPLRGGNRGAGVRLSFDERPPASRVQGSRTVGLEALKPGQYRLTVTIEGGGQSVTNTRNLNIVKP